MRIGYARVSTAEQILDLQLSALKKYECDHIFSDFGFSGANFNRPGFQDALNTAGPGSTIVVWRLDRLGRSLRHLVEVMSDLRAREVGVVSLTEGIDTRSPTGQFTFHIIAALAEFERALISERTRAGIAAARDRGRRPGRPSSLTRSQIELAVDLLKSNSEKSVASALNVHHKTLRRQLRKFGLDESLTSNALAPQVTE
ncbi:recombinase family protein [Paraburkholderia humisilvae]|uniref:DNA-invertase hin n=1 Tax=Paraburkholderia humisilvae TaxID=627669 RepID=A0A6J5FA79_9BURK|nr:recombinase family protein [Paraburkholderia humisilvae]CAB3774572.1 DNA-invertase hin [Paraburkholderia humisilvae]